MISPPQLLQLRFDLPRHVGYGNIWNRGSCWRVTRRIRTRCRRALALLVGSLCCCFAQSSLLLSFRILSSSPSLNKKQKQKLTSDINRRKFFSKKVAIESEQQRILFCLNSIQPSSDFNHFESI